MDYNYHAILDGLRGHFNSGATKPYEARLEALNSLYAVIQEHEAEAFSALNSDLGKSPTESFISELGLVLKEISHARKNLKQWIKPKTVKTPLALWPGRSRIMYEPLGVALLIAPWNYPLHLSLMPLVAAVAAGNCVLLKPSSQAPASGQVLRKIISQAFAPEHVGLVNIDGAAATRLLEQRFDFIFYTGSRRAGYEIMSAAACHLTPLCLELGGKSPVLVTKSADLALAARRIAWGKLLNAGQTCVAPDYLWVDRRVAEEFAEMLRHVFRHMLGDDPLANPEYGRIINQAAFERLLRLAGGELVADRAALKIAPTVIPVRPDHALMDEEIFGPLLPLLTYDDLQEALTFISSREKSLALYLFNRDRQTEKLVLQNLSFGGGCINDVVMQVASPWLPFGGVGGMGRYHGRAGFELFSNCKSIVRQSSFIDIPLRYPPYSARRLDFLRRILK